MLRGAVLPTAVAGAAATAVSAAVSGGSGAAGAAAGCLLVIAFFGVDFAALPLVRHQSDAPLLLAVFGYVVKMLGLGVLLVAVGDHAPVGRIAFAVAVFGCTVVWLTGHVRVFGRVTAAGAGTPAGPGGDAGAAAGAQPAAGAAAREQR
jgi:ATP synthase protein I